MTRDAPAYFELADDALISFTGDDAVAFLHAQLTSDVAGLAPLATQYSGYCSPKGRLLSTFLAWRLENELLLQLPAALREPIQSRIARYVLRAKVKVADATSRYTLFGIAGPHAAGALSRIVDCAAPARHRVSAASGVHVAAIPTDRYVLLANVDASDVRVRLESAFEKHVSTQWTALDVAAGIPVVTGAAQDEYVPQMVNLDLIGGVSFSKGCYPGQEIVARMHYLGRLKQRMYRIRVRGARDLEPGRALYSNAFGAHQASGSVLVASGDEALAVIQKAGAQAQDVRLGALDGPQAEILALPYTLPD